MPRRLNQKSWQLRPFVTLGTGKAGFHQGLDVEHPLNPALSSRFVINPDFSEVEAAFETIDVSYVEQFLPEKREFFIQGSEFFEALGPPFFFSRRIQQFDVGGKLTGAFGGYRLGFLGTFDGDRSRRDFALSLACPLSTNSGNSNPSTPALQT